MKLTSLFLFLSVVVLGCTTVPALADSVPVQNASFEITNPLNTPCGANCSYNSTTIPGWNLVGIGGSWHPSSAYYNLPLPDGSIVAYSNGGTISQTLAATLLPDATYTLSVDIGHRLDGFANNYSIALFAGSSLLAFQTGSNGTIPLGTFMDESFTYTSGFTPPSGNLDIVLASFGPQIDFDNVRLSQISEPGSLALLVAGLGLAFSVLRRR